MHYVFEKHEGVRRRNLYRLFRLPVFCGLFLSRVLPSLQIRFELVRTGNACEDLRQLVVQIIDGPKKAVALFRAVRCVVVVALCWLRLRSVAETIRDLLHVAQPQVFGQFIENGSRGLINVPVARHAHRSVICGRKV